MTRNEWHIKDVPESTRRIYKVYAAANGLSLGQALTKGAELLATQQQPPQQIQQQVQSPANDNTWRSKQSGTRKRAIISADSDFPSPQVHQY